MREMKDSGVAWIGEIPETWKVTINKTILKNISERNHPDAEVLSLYRDLGVVPKNSRDDNHNVTSENTAQYKFVEKGSLVINKMKAWQGSLAVSNYEGIVSPAYYVCEFRNNHISKDYVHYLLRSNIYAQQFERLSTGMRVGQWDLSIDDFLATQLLVPPEKEQFAIAECLDKKSLQIDALIVNVQAQIEKLKTYKQSLITEVVTKGLDPNAPMKDSGVEWAPKIPANWEMSRIGLHYSIILGKMLCPKPADDSYTLEPYYCAANVHFGNICSDELKKMWFSPYEKELYHVEVGDVLIVEGGAGAGGCAVVQQPTETLVQNSVMIVRNKSNSDNRYLRYWVESLVGRGYIEVVCNKATIPHFTKEKLSRTVYPVMSPKEQVQIADFLDKKCSQIEQLITLKESKIEKLQQYKRSLIYEYVTGKKEVV